MWPFTSRAERRQGVFELAELLLVKRIEAEAKVEEARANAALKNLERELKLKDQQLEFYNKRREEARLRAQNQRRDPKRRYPNRFGPLRREAERPECGLCDDPMRRDVTLEMVALHNQHGDKSHAAQQVNGEARD